MTEKINSTQSPIFQNIKQGDIVYLTADGDHTIYKCPVLKIQKHATWEAMERDNNAREIFIDWNGIWITLMFKDWEHGKLSKWNLFNHIAVFTEEEEAREFMKKDIEFSINTLTQSKLNSQYELENSQDITSILHWRDQISEIEKQIKELKEYVNNI